MRKITKEAVYTFMYNTNKNWRKSNMDVVISETWGDVYLRLHGNTIAKRKMGSLKIQITTAGWDTTTTKERLRGIPGVASLSTKNGKMYLNGKEWDGSWITL